MDAMDVDSPGVSPERVPRGKKPRGPGNSQKLNVSIDIQEDPIASEGDFEGEEEDQIGESGNQIETITELKRATNGGESDREEGEFDEAVDETQLEQEESEEVEESESEIERPNKEDERDGDYEDSDQAGESDGESRRSRPPRDQVYKAQCQARVQIVRSNIVKDKKKFDDEVTTELMKRVAANPKINDRPKVAKLAVQNQFAQRVIQLLDTPHRLRVLAEVKELAGGILEEMIDAKEEQQIRKKEVASASSVAKETGVHIRLNEDPARYETLEERHRIAALMKTAERYIEGHEDHEARVEALVKLKTIRRPVYQAHQALLRDIVEAALSNKIIEKLPDDERGTAEKELKLQIKWQSQQARMKIDPQQLAGARRSALVAIACAYGIRNDLFDNSDTPVSLLAKYERVDDERKRKIESRLTRDVLDLLEDPERDEALKEIEQRAMAAVKEDAFQRASASFFKQLAPASKIRENSIQLSESSRQRQSSFDVGSGSDEEEDFPPPKRSKISLLVPSNSQLVGTKRKRVEPKSTYFGRTKPRISKGRRAMMRLRPGRMGTGNAFDETGSVTSRGGGAVSWGNSGGHEEIEEEREVGEILSPREIENRELRKEVEDLRRSLEKAYSGPESDWDEGGVEI